MRRCRAARRWAPTRLAISTSSSPATQARDFDLSHGWLAVWHCMRCEDAATHVRGNSPPAGQPCSSACISLFRTASGYPHTHFHGPFLEFCIVIAVRQPG
jgi:hypothetical protein